MTVTMIIMTDNNHLDLAHRQLQSAFAVLQKAGLTEHFFAMALETGQTKWERQFGKFGDPFGVRIEIEKTEVPGEVLVRISVVYGRSFFYRLKDAVREFFSILFSARTTTSVYLSEDDTSRLKGLLRNL